MSSQIFRKILICTLIFVLLIISFISISNFNSFIINKDNNISNFDGKIGIPTAEIIVNSILQENNFFAGVVYVDDDYDSSTPGWGVDHFDSIQDGVNAVDLYGLVNVYAGSYYEQVRINKTVTVIGESQSLVIINPSGSEFEGPRVGDDKVRAAVTFETGSDGSVLSTLTIENDFKSDLNDNSGIELINGGIDNVVVDNVSVNAVDGHGFGSYHKDYTWPPLSGWIIENCSISTSAGGFYFSGIRAENMDNLIIQDCDVGPTNFNGIWLMNVNVSIVQRCDVHDTIYAGIFADNLCTNEIYISYNDVYNTNSAEDLGFGDVKLHGQYLPDPHGDNPAIVTVNNNILHDSYNGLAACCEADLTTRTYNISNNNIINHIFYGAANSAIGSINATHNWWGDASGPGGAGPGTGDNISVDVDYYPWLDAPSPNGNPLDDPPEISNIDIQPDIQETDKYVNISCIVMDDISVDFVRVDFTYPDGSSGYEFMEGNYYFNSTYYQAGTYNFTIYAVDTYGESNTSAVYDFYIYDSAVAYVDDDYDSSIEGWQIDRYNIIQDGIDYVTTGGSVFVMNGTYDEQLVFDKALTLDAESSNAIIQPSATSQIGSYDLEINASNVVIQDFTLDFNDINDSRGGLGITVSNLNGPITTNVEIKNNTIYSGDGSGLGNICIQTGQNSDISNLIIKNNIFYCDFDTIGEGVYVRPGPGTNILIDDNSFYGNISSGITIEASDVTCSNNYIYSNVTTGLYGIRFIDVTGGETYGNVVIKYNDIINVEYGVRVGTDNPVGSTFITDIDSNEINNCGIGIWLRNGSSSSIIKNNNIENNNYGFHVSLTSNNNQFYHNNFITNIINAFDEASNTWDNGSLSGGNYWDDYTGTDSDGDGIGDTPYQISGGNNQDLYPLMYQWNENEPIAEFIYSPTYRKFDGSSSWDRDGIVVNWTWDFGDGATGYGEIIIHTYYSPGIYNVKLTVTDDNGLQGSIIKSIDAEGNKPPNAPVISGPTSGIPNKHYSFAFLTVDPDGDDIYYNIFWGDGSFEDWIGPNKSDQIVSLEHEWLLPGYYTIMARAKDTWGTIGEWSEVKLLIRKDKSIIIQSKSLVKTTSIKPFDLPLIRIG